MIRIFAIIVTTLVISSCVSDTHEAPVLNGWKQPNALKSQYRVKKGDTLYSIAWAFDMDYRALARANGLASPYYQLEPGQYLSMNIKAYKPVIVQKEYSQPMPTTISQWIWPIRGRIAEGYSPARAGNRGIDIAGREGDPIRASAAGVVVYSGDGIRGYGNLIIIKHNDNYLSAYAYNRDNKVTLGTQVNKGQIIALMGRNNAGKPSLHFEIRKDGKPVNPLNYLS